MDKYPPQQQPWVVDNQLCGVSSPSKGPMKGNSLEKKFAISKLCRYVPSQGHDTIAWYTIKIQLGSDNLLPGHGFGYVCTVTMTSEIWPCIKVMKHLGSRTTIVRNIIQIQIWQWGVMARTRILGMCALWPWSSEIWPWVMVMTHPSVIDNKCVQYYPDSIWQWGVMAQTRISGICTLWPWPWRYDLGLRSWHTLGSWTTMVWSIIWQWGVVARTRISSMCALWPWPWRYYLE